MFLRVLSSIFLVSFFTQVFIGNAFAMENNEDSYFIVTAYYSPLPDQKHYLTGNYEDEIVLNGKGIAGASGKKVFSGMLAAPAKYSFGTKIYLDGLGIGSVEDRGGAIVEAGERGYGYDRIDVWMGYGDEGLKRALFWGKRKVYGYTIDSGNQVNLDYSSIPSPDWSIPTNSSSTSTNTAKEEKSEKRLEYNFPVFDTSFTKGSKGEQVKKLQTILEELGYISKNNYISGEYEEKTIDAIFTFQKNHSIVQKESDLGAGVFGPKTRTKFLEVYKKYLTEKEKEDIMLKEIANLKDKALDVAEKKISLLGKPMYGDISPEVRNLQKYLNQLGFFPYKDTAIFGVKTQNALIDYQVAYKLIKKLDESGAGAFGPATRAQMTQDIMEQEFQNLLQKSEYKIAYELYLEENTLKENVSFFDTLPHSKI